MIVGRFNVLSKTSVMLALGLSLFANAAGHCMDDWSYQMAVVRRIGLAWYRAEDWDLLMKLFEDRDVMHDSYADWLRDAERTERELLKAGHRVERAVIEPIEFGLWCRSRGIARNAKARTEYATLYARDGGV